MSIKVISTGEQTDRIFLKYSFYFVNLGIEILITP
jgi:hypothetical protein